MKCNYDKAMKKRVFKQHLYALSPYHPPLEGRDHKAYLLLDFNERTSPVSPIVKQALIEYINNDALQVYPSYGEICKSIATYAEVAPESVMITNGSDQGIDLVFRASCSEADEVVIPSPSFPIYLQCARVENLKIIEPPYSISGGFPTEAVLEQISPQTKLVVIPSPNNPTGTGVSREEIIQILEKTEAVVLVDECYFEYTKSTVADLVSKYPNLVISRTFSKTWGLASLRIGYLISNAENIEQLIKIRGPYDINRAAVIAVQAALANPSYMQDYVREVLEQSKPMLESFLSEAGISFWPSVANYILTYPENPERVVEEFKKEGILVRPRVDREGKKCVRISIGTKEETSRLIKIFRAII